VKQQDPPIGVAFAQAVKSIRIRFVRQLATAAGVFLGIALFASVRVSLAAGAGEASEAAKLRLLVFLSLLMALVGITNSMLMSVTERFKEIGTLKCLGATNSFIVKVFFIEALIVGLIASAIGGIVGFCVILITRFLTQASDAAALWDHFLPVVLVATALGTVITIVAAIVPAIQAARLPAAAALRVEV
jgi:ABC-type antimicrobial peptide transport system permease subunit